MVRDSLKKLFRQMERGLNSLSYDLRWKPRYLIDNPERELKVDFGMVASNLMLRKRNVFFIEIGANDGVSNDPVYPFARDHNWSGLVIEPLPEVFEDLKKNYEDYPLVTPLNFAIGKSDGQQTLYTVRMDSETFTRAHQFSSFLRDVVERQSQWVPDIADRIEECTVPCVSFNTLIQRYATGRSVDVVQIDAEGFDFEILKLIDFNVLKPSIISYESANLSKSDRDGSVNLLLEHGYQVTMGDLDTIAYQMAFDKL